MLLENSLYTDQAGRDALVKDKKRAMDALCFSLLGFLGCYQLAQNRAFLKTYQQTEGQLRLNAISDTNHDVSLSVKLAAEAQAIPQAAAMNVTKLLYKIKSKQIRGPLDEKLIRDVIATLKIGSHRPDTMVFSVVSQFEDGSIGLGQLAHKLYNLSKVKQFQSVSGEFRQLVMKGQYQELFAKIAPTTGSAPVSAPVTVTSSAPKHVAPVVSAPVPVQAPKMSLQSGGFQNCPDSLLEPFFKEMLTQYSWTPAVLRDNVVRFCKKNSIILDLTAPQFAAAAANQSLQKFMVERFEKKDYGWAGTVSNYPKWIAGMDGSGMVQQIQRLVYLNWYGKNRHLFLEGKFEEFDSAMGPMPNRSDYQKTYFIDDYNDEFIRKILSPELFWPALERLKDKFIAILDRAAFTIETAAGSSKRALQSPHMSLTPEVWTTLALARRNSSYWRAKSAFCAGYENMDLPTLFSKAFGLENSNVAVKKETGGQAIIMTAKLDYFKTNPRLHKAAEILENVGQLKFIDITDAFSTMTDLALKWYKANANQYGFFQKMATTALDSFGNYDIIHTEKFVEWTADQIESGKIGFNVFYASALPDGDYTPDACQYCWNTYVEFANKYPHSITFTNWLAMVAWLNRQEKHTKDPSAWTELRGIFINSARYFKDADVDQGFASGSLSAKPEYMFDVIDATIKAGKWKFPQLGIKAWNQLMMHGPKNDTFYNTWNFDEATASALYSGYQSSGFRDQLMIRYPGLRNARLQAWMNRAKQRPNEWVFALRTFLREEYGWALEENMLQPDVKAFLMDCIAHIDTARVQYSELTSGGRTLKPWIDKPIREGLLKVVHATTSMTTVANAQSLMDKNDFNAYVTKKSIQDFANDIVVNGTSDATNLCDILNKIAHHPNNYNVQVLLRFAYAMHKNVKEIRAAGTAQYANAAYESVCEALNSLMASGRADEVDQVYDALSFAPDLRTKILDWFRKSAVLKNALDSVKEDAVKSLVPVDQKRMNQLMKFNNIKFPAVMRKTKDTKLSDIIKTHATFDLEPLAITEDKLDEKALKRRTAEYDAFNKYRHGNIGVKFLRSFHVAIPSQIAANKVWDDAHPTAERMDPVFHGTGSVAATFVLRYGFAVISATDASVVGRMLGNGIYFSNVLDKCGQYVSDGGYSRGKGTKGYIFQMKANLGAYGTDYKSQGQGLVSPEWCVFHPNDQLNIYKAHFVELVDKNEIDFIKAETSLNENFFKVEQFKEHLNEDLQNPIQKGCVSYTFIDGQIPVSEDVVIDFEEFDATSFGSHVTMEPSGLGPVIYIEVDDPEINEIYAIRYTVQFMSQHDDFQRFLDLLAKRVVK